MGVGQPPTPHARSAFHYIHTSCNDFWTKRDTRGAIAVNTPTRTTTDQKKQRKQHGGKTRRTAFADSSRRTGASRTRTAGSPRTQVRFALGWKSSRQRPPPQINRRAPCGRQAVNHKIRTRPWTSFPRTTDLMMPIRLWLDLWSFQKDDKSERSEEALTRPSRSDRRHVSLSRACLRVGEATDVEMVAGGKDRPGGGGRG